MPEDVIVQKEFVYLAVTEPNTKHLSIAVEKHWLFYSECHHLEEREANVQKPEIPDNV